MKKLLLTLALAFTTSLALADFVVLETGKSNAVGNTSNDVFFKYNYDFNKHFAADVENLTVQITNDGAVTHTVQDRAELGVVGRLPLGFATLQGRISYGTKFSTTNYDYYTYSPSIVVPVANTGITLKAEYRWRKSVTEGKEDTQISRIGGWYDLTKNDSIGYRFDHYTGSSPQNINSVFYQRSF
jgi:hypothetical protein